MPLIALGACVFPTEGAGQVQVAQRALADLTIEELSNIRITTPSRREERQRDAAAAVHVITRDEIRRSGVTRIAEALRLAPGVEVARRGQDTWAITLRGFNSDLSNKLLVLIDGRSVYSPLYAGVFWDVQDVLLEDVERIEVVSGPGGALWGANAVNGVINIITRSAFDTGGGFVEVGGGNDEPYRGGFRYGARMGPDAAGRGYVRYYDVDRDDDARDRIQAGFRLDWTPAADTVTVQGDVYRRAQAGVFMTEFDLGTLPGSAPGEVVAAGHNLLGRWTRSLPDGDLQLQVYFDHTRRDIPGNYNERRDTIDLDFQHGFRVGSRHEILWGLGFRHTEDELDNTTFSTFVPASRTDHTVSAFVQHRVDLARNRLFLTLGSKFEHNDYTDFEVQPNARLAWHPTDRQVVWAAVSRAVRVPSRLESDLRLTAPLPLDLPGLPSPIYVTVDGSDAFGSEELMAWEAGYRVSPAESLSVDLAVFYNEYDDVVGQAVGSPVPSDDPPYTVIPATLVNALEGDARGATLAVNWQAHAAWRLQWHYSWLDLELRPKPGFEGVSALHSGGDSPRHQYALRAFGELGRNLELYAALRRVDELPNQGVDSYTAFDLGLRWWATQDLAFSLTGQNLNDDRHIEFASGGLFEVERSVHGRVTWRF